MTQILVIADDFTGAAEIGGLAHQFGLSVRFVTEPGDIHQYTEEVVVIDTDSRNCSGSGAFKEVGKYLGAIDLSRFDLVFKKTDSVLRGRVESEIRAILQKSGLASCLLVPANPFKNRVIKNGHYQIEGIPIHETDFANDPDYPRTDSNVLNMILDRSEIEHSDDLSLLDQKNRIIIPNVPSLGAIDGMVSNLSDKDCLFAGGADFFRALLSVRLGLAENATYSYSPIDGKQHFVIGSKSRSTNDTIALLLKSGYEHFPFRMGKQSALKSKINEAIQKGGEVLISRPEHKIVEHSAILRLTEGLATVAAFLVNASSPNDEICMEGGETARAILHKTNNMQLTIESVLADGVVKFRSQSQGIHLVVKPGSYPWPDMIIKRIGA